MPKLSSSNCLNRNILECKSEWTGTLSPVWLCLNRNILECKFFYLDLLVKFLDSLNRNILECKCLSSVFGTCSSIVLIETYWNVNSSTLMNGTIMDFVLIETYWNVNSSVGSLNAVRRASLNRNILECKFLYRFRRASV